MTYRFRQSNKLEISQKKLNCVFMSFYAYIKINNKNTGGNDIFTPVTLMQMRTDGAVGFPGGKVEKSDYPRTLNSHYLKRALTRELKEELNLDMYLDFNKIEHLSTFSSDNLYVHNFSYQLTEEQFMDIFRQSNNPLNLSENSGCFICHLDNFGKGKSYKNFQKNNFKETSLSELRLLKERVKLVS